MNKTIAGIMDQLKDSSHPVAKSIHHQEHTNVLAIAFKKGMQLKDHKTARTSTLFVVRGTVLYIQGDVETSLHEFEDLQIPVNIIHAVTALEDSLCLLIQG